MNDTSTGGYLVGKTSRPNINHLIHDQICGILNLNNTLVRPKNQPLPPPPPSFGTDWVAFGSSMVAAEGFAYVDGDGNTQRQEHFTVTASIYGANADVNARNLRDGLEIVQNWENMSGFKYVGSTNYIRVPELHNGRWLQRYDLTYNMSQNAPQTYSILTIEGLSDSEFEIIKN